MHASVYKCFLKADTQRAKPYAVKIVREDDDEKILAHKNEYEIMKRLNCDNIVKTYEIFINEYKKEVHSIMEFIDGKEIFD